MERSWCSDCCQIWGQVLRRRTVETSTLQALLLQQPFWTFDILETQIQSRQGCSYHWGQWSHLLCIFHILYFLSFRVFFLGILLFGKLAGVYMIQLKNLHIVCILWASKKRNICRIQYFSTQIIQFAGRGLWNSRSLNNYLLVVAGSTIPSLDSNCFPTYKHASSVTVCNFIYTNNSITSYWSLSLHNIGAVLRYCWCKPNISSFCCFKLKALTWQKSEVACM